MADRGRDARGRFTGGGGESVGGIVASVEVDDGGIDPALAKLSNALDIAAQKFNATRAAADPVTHAMADIASQSTRAATGFTRAAAAADESGKAAGRARANLLLIGNTLDDLQYVAEMGIRPIINNLMQIAPAVGVGLIVLDQLMRNWDKISGMWEQKSPFPKSKVEAEDLARSLTHVGKEIDKLRELESLDNEQLSRANALITQRAFLEKLVTEEKRKQSELEAFRKAKSPEETTRGGAFMAAVNGDQPGFEKSLNQALVKERDQDIERARARMQRDIARSDAGPGSDQEKLDYANSRKGEFANYERGRKAEDTTALVEDMTRRLAAGDPKAMSGLRGLMDAATGVVIGGEGFRDRLEAGIPETKEERDQRELEAKGREQGRKIEKEMKAKAEAKAEKDRADLLQAEGDDAKDNDDNFKKYIDDKIASGKELTMGEAANLSPEQVKKMRDLRGKKLDAGLKDDADLERLGERDNDLNYRLRQLMNPTREGKSMGLDAYEQSHRSTSGDSPELRRLHAIWEVQKEIRDNLKKAAVIKAKPR